MDAWIRNSLLCRFRMPPEDDGSHYEGDFDKRNGVSGMVWVAEAIEMASEYSERLVLGRSLRIWRLPGAPPEEGTGQRGVGSAVDDVGDGAGRPSGVVGVQLAAADREMETVERLVSRSSSAASARGGWKVIEDGDLKLEDSSPPRRDDDGGPNRVDSIQIIKKLLIKLGGESALEDQGMLQRERERERETERERERETEREKGDGELSRPMSPFVTRASPRGDDDAVGSLGARSAPASPASICSDVDAVQGHGAKAASPASERSEGRRVQERRNVSPGSNDGSLDDSRDMRFTGVFSSMLCKSLQRHTTHRIPQNPSVFA
jgi:hypothetical protein